MGVMETYEPVTVQLTAAGRPVKIHLFSTGRVAVKSRFRETRVTGLVSTLDFILDRRWTEWLPIWVMVIEHPEGIFVIDTGERAVVSDRGYFRTSGVLAEWFDSSQFRFSVRREEEVDRQLERLGIGLGDVRAVVLTHLHFDHTDGLCYFPDTPILVNRLEWERPFGALPRLWPAWFRPGLLELEDSLEDFSRICWLTEARDLALVHTPGHTYGHCSVLLRTDGCHVLFAADVCYSQEQLLRGGFAANAASRRMARETYRVVKEYGARHPMVFVASHDGEAGERLEKLQVLI